MSAVEAGTSGANRTPAVRRGPWRVFWVLALVEFISVMDASAVNVALPSIGADLDFSATTLAWPIDAYVVGFAGFMLLAGRAADIVGRRRLFVAGVLVFATFSVACALATEPWLLVGSRLLQGLGAALVFPAALALITDIFPQGPDRNRALGIFSGMAGLAAPFGLVLGGLLTSAAWQWIFLINVPICVFVLIAARLLPRSTRTRSGHLDVTGALAVTGGLVLLILAVLRGGAQGWTSMLTLAELTVALVLLGVFAVRQVRGSAPLLPVSLFDRRNVVFGNVIFALVGANLIATLFFVALFLQQVRGFGPMAAAFVTLPVPLGMLAGTLTAPRLFRFGPPNVLAAGLLIQAVALAGWMVTISADRSIAVSFAIPAALWAYGVGISIVASFVVCTMGVAGPEAGAASGLATTSYQAGGALGLSLLAVLADSRTAAVADRLGEVAGLVSGYSWALACAAGLAVIGVALTRFIPVGPEV